MAILLHAGISVPFGLWNSTIELLANFILFLRGEDEVRAKVWERKSVLS
jgi:hypothetical protein